jgi:uncharacterized membrane protein YgcG
MNATSRTTAAVLPALMFIATALIAQQAAPPAQTPPAQTVSADITAPVAASPASTPEPANSKVRIVRLSEVKGAVQFDVGNGQGFEAAMVNLPIVEQTRLQTGTGVAEVEFEDNSTLRLGPDSLVEFPKLELRPSGAKVSTVHVLKGIAYVSLAGTPGNEFTVVFGQQQAHLQPSSHIRLILDPNQATLAVLEGTALVEGPAGTTEVGKKKTLTFNLASQDPPKLAAHVESDPLDSWDHDSVDYHKRFQNLSAFGNPSYSYGGSDMLYYGSFINAGGGCGSMWQPYFVSTSWDPYANGALASYPGGGYSWVSPYPWGWTPFHSGSWSYCPNAGWGWQPGGTWNGLTSTPAAATGGQRGPVLLPPLRTGLAGRPTLTMVNLKPLTASTLSSSDTFVFRKDSAGLGIPRGTLGKLDKLSERADQHGAVARPVYAVAPPATSNARTANTAMAPASLHQGYAISSRSEASSASPSMSSASSGSGMSSSSTGSSSMARASSSGGGSSGGGRPR